MKLTLGAHISVAGGLHRSLYEGQLIGADTVQIFTRNQRQWNAKPLAGVEIELWERALAETGLGKIMSHASYLINLGSIKEETRLKSEKAFVDEIKRCQRLKINYLVFHPGAAVGGGREECLDRIAESMLKSADICDGTTKILMEATAGQGTVVGSSFEELAYVLEKVKGAFPVGICLDTCHIFAAGYDIRTAAGWDIVLKKFDKLIGLEYLSALHLNDSLKPFDSHKDRHSPLGEGEIGLDSFEFLVKDSRTAKLPMYLETPGGCELWKKEIAMLRKIGE